jgi:hypothetical protein
MSHKNIRIVLLGSLILLLFGCSPAALPEPPQSKSPLPFSKLYPIKDMNNSISLALDTTEQNNLKSGSNVFLQVQNQSDQQIWFEADWQARIYQSVSSGADLWMPVENGVQYAGDGIVLYPKSGGGNTTYSIVCIPLLTSSQSATVRVVVTGQIYKNKQKTGVPVSAYTDLTITP